MRVALISEHASPLATIGGVDAGGQNVYVAQVATWLAKMGHHVDVFTRREQRGQSVTEWGDRLNVIHVPAGPARVIPKENLLRHMPEFARHVMRFCMQVGRYDVVHANFFMSGLVGLHLKQAFATPLVTTFHALGLVRRLHQGSADGFPAERTTIERLLVRESDCIIAECPQDAQDLIELYGAERERMTIVPCGVDLSEFGPRAREQARAELGLPAQDFIVLQLGRLVQRKGIDNVVEAIGVLRREHAIKARLVVVGGDSDDPRRCTSPELARLREIAQTHEVAEQVLFVGRRQRHQLRDYYAAADVFVTTPWYEPFGITPLEAMACGVPVVGSRVGGIQYSVRNGLTGFLVPPNAPQSLAQRLAYLHDHPGHAQALGRAGLRRARAAFTWESVTQRLTQVYRSLTPAYSNLDERRVLREAPGRALSNRAAEQEQQ